MPLRHFLSLLDFAPEELAQLIARAHDLRLMRQRGEDYAPFTRKILGMIFEKSSTRTRVSFEAGMAQLGGSAIFLSPHDTQLGRGEPVADTAMVVSRMVDIITIRTYAHATLANFAAHSVVPVINALSDVGHPCQLLADLQTFSEHCGPIQGRTVAWIGDGNNMCNSYIEAAAQFDFHLRIAAPEGYDPSPELLARFSNRVELGRDPLAAASNADLVTTDVWTSMGQEQEQTQRAKVFADFQVSADLMAQTKTDAIFLHCLPAHRGEEVAADVIDGPRSRVWDQAENRLHSQKALIEFLLNSASAR